MGISSKIIFIFYIIQVSIAKLSIFWLKELQTLFNWECSILIKLKDKSIAKVNKQREALISIKGLGKNRKNNKWKGDVYLEIKKK